VLKIGHCPSTRAGREWPTWPATTAMPSQAGSAASAAAALAADPDVGRKARGSPRLSKKLLPPLTAAFPLEASIRAAPCSFTLATLRNGCSETGVLDTSPVPRPIFVVTTSDTLGFLFVSSWGLWWLLAPQSVIRSYSWFHDEKLRRKPPRMALPKPIGVRVAGLLWLALVVGVFLFGRRS
jgi:hypothetical protein